MTLFESLDVLSFGGNSAYDYLRAIAILVGFAVALKIAQVVILKRLQKLAEKTHTDIDDTIIAIVRSIRPPLYFLAALYFAMGALVVGPVISGIISIGFVFVLVWETIRAVEKFMEYFASKRIALAEAEGEDVRQAKTMTNAIRIVVKIALWTIGIIMALSNIGVDITSLVAGLGIGGIAVALALQNILSDLFSSFSLFIDKPFVVGDYIVIGGDAGTVEHIGLKSTRIRTLQGQQLIVSNKELTTARVQNYKKMTKRRVVFTLGVEYGLPLEKLQTIPGIIRGTIDDCDNVEYDRSHLSAYAASSIDFETVYFVKSADYNEYMDINQKIYYEIYERFTKEGIPFAFPTQTIHLLKS